MIQESNPRLENLFKSVNLREVFSEETQHREPAPESTITPIVSEPGQLHESPTSELPNSPVAPLPDKAPYDAQKNAESLVYGLQALEQTVLTPVTLGKLHHSIGGKPTKQKMKAAYIKQMNGEELDETEQRLVKSLDDYNRKMMLLSDSILPTEKKTEFLIKAAIPYCKETELEVKSGLAFWAAFSGDFVEKVTKILMS